MSSYREAEGLALLQLLYENPEVPVAVDTETSGLKVALDDWCIGVSIACVINDTPYSHYYAFAHPTGENLPREVIDKLGYVLQQNRLLIFANVQFDILSMDTMGIRLDESNFIDICTMAHFINENQPFNKGVDSLAEFYLGEPGKVKDKHIDTEKKTGWPTVTPVQMWDYAVMDAVSTWRIWYQLQDHPVWKALPSNIWPDKQELIRCLIEMKRRGVLINTATVEEMIAVGEPEVGRLRAELGMNPASHKDMEKLFIDTLQMPILKASKKTGKPSFTKEVMEEYDLILERLDSPVAKLVKQYRGWTKALSAAYRPYLALLDSDGRLRCSYKTHGTATGRLSCAEPNLQQIPKSSDKPWNGKVKECFVAKEGYTLVNADFSQLELRLGTAYAGESSLAKVFEEGRDIFTEMSKQLGMERHDTKTLVYSMQYGAGEKRIMSAFGVTQERAQKIRNNYFNTYPRFKALADACDARAKSTGMVKIWTGRYRHFMFSSESYKALNSVIQGGAADIVERVMVRCFRELDNEDCQMLLQVHDSITFEVRTELVDHYIPLIKELMEDVSGAVGHEDFNVKFAVEVGLWTE